MKISLRWLKDYISLPLPPDELAEKLTMSGNEVDAVETVGANWEKVFVGQVTSLEKHPNADRLVLATVDLGSQKITVVTGAPNLEAGQKVPFAHVGAELIDGHTGKPSRLKPARIRGIDSEGMVCSEKELGLSDRHEGIMVLSPDAPVGAPLHEHLGDTIFDIKTTPNRPDCLSVLGIAHEVAALTGGTVQTPDLSYPEDGSFPVADSISIEIHDPELCSRYCASLVKNIKIKPSPDWMQRRLLASGMRPINNVVDITNYVMLEFGQPLHAFDYETIKGRKIIVRRAREAEFLYTLDGIKRDLDPDMLLIADETDAIALAGVMGGAETEVIETTKSILLESANFNGASIRRTSTRLNLRSEASSRFEKGISPELAPIALRRATQLLIELAEGKAAAGIADVYPVKPDSRPVLLPRKRINRILGLDFDLGEAKSILLSLGFQPEPAKGEEALLVTVPYWRTDIRLHDDLIEEIARIKGYDEIPTTMLRGEIPEYVPDPMLELRDSVNSVLVSCGMQEIITYSLVSKAALERVDPQHLLGTAARAANPMSQEQEYLRTSLRPGLLATFASNLRHEQNGIRIFETGKVYFPREADLPEERQMLAGVMGGPRFNESWLAPVENMDFYDAKGVLEALFERLQVDATFVAAEDQITLPGRTAAIVSNGKRIGVVGELHPAIASVFDISIEPVVLFELNLAGLLPFSGEIRKYEPIPRFPGIARDLAFVVDAAVPARSVQDAIESFPLVREVRIFDVYSGEQVPRGKKSIAFSVRYQSRERTLTDAEIDSAQRKIVERVQAEFGATLRA